mgnify:CR=1 FL=1
MEEPKTELGKMALELYDNLVDKDKQAEKRLEKKRKEKAEIKKTNYGL